MVAEQVTITWQARSETNTISTLPTSPSGDAPDHQEDRAEKRNKHPGEDQPGDRVHQDSPESVH